MYYSLEYYFHFLSSKDDIDELKLYKLIIILIHILYYYINTYYYINKLAIFV